MLNHVVLMGRLTDNPDVRSVGNGISRASFTLAVNRDFKDKDSGNYEADFIDITAWRHTAEFVGKYFTKGLLVAVEGRLQIESYTDREGVKRRAARVQASQCHFAESRKDGGGGGGNYATGFTPPPPSESPSGGFSGGNYSTPASGGGFAPASDYAAPSGRNPYVTPATPASNGEQFRTLSGDEQDDDLPF